MEAFLSRPNKIRERQIALQSQAGKEFVYLRGPRQKLWFRAYMTLFTVSFVGANFQLLQYVRGKAKKVGEE
ncbi:hypothetical protein CI109_107101 [Kwoniella shandongensis]|uniref:Uncharacterized protein n=1 Tax=Kwoniella shandongensis TaxID=1734106 RepID=A0A5M6C231_9TREE|nr:uncharacterized protein CI109_002384 [Kwoniella shandongensis]KAA5529043.1 hypothetical protein CI109_002384 [Kwoniella shandongensis]